MSSTLLSTSQKLMHSIKPHNSMRRLYINVCFDGKNKLYHSTTTSSIQRSSSLNVSSNSLLLLNFRNQQSLARSHEAFSRNDIATISEKYKSTIIKRNMAVVITKTTTSDAISGANSSASTTTATPEKQNDKNTTIVQQDNNIISITPSAIEQIYDLTQQKNKTIHNKNITNDTASSTYYLRVYVDAGGCSGFQYKFEMQPMYDHETNTSTIDPEEDVVIQASFLKDIGEEDSTSSSSLPVFPTDEQQHPQSKTKSVKLSSFVVVDDASLDLIKGSTIDYVREMIRSSFAIINNPQSESACGCGSSFAIKNFGANPALD